MTSDLNKWLNAFRNSQIFVSICAVLMGAESYIIAGMPQDFVVLAAIFFSTLFIYNASRLNLDFSFLKQPGNYRMEITGGKMHLFLAGLSIPVVFVLMTSPGFSQVLIFMITALLSLAYMMPFSREGKPLKGLRNHLVLKNIILSITWAAATVLFPLNSFPVESEVVFMFLRRFFFIYALTVIFDFRDVKSDAAAGMNTLALKLGLVNARWISLLSIFMFFIFTSLDPFLQNKEMTPVNIALFLSGIITVFIILATSLKKGKSYYSYVIDGAMALQFLLIFLLYH